MQHDPLPLISLLDYVHSKIKTYYLLSSSFSKSFWS